MNRPECIGEIEEALEAGCPCLNFGYPTLEKLLAYVRELEKDAGRYRAIREHADVILREAAQFATSSGKLIWTTQPSSDELDDAIDAAIASQSKDKA
jgi:hypothetical protein